MGGLDLSVVIRDDDLRAHRHRCGDMQCVKTSKPCSRKKPRMHEDCAVRGHNLELLEDGTDQLLVDTFPQRRAAEFRLQE